MKLTNIFPQIKTDNKIPAKRAEGVAAAKAEQAGAPVTDRVVLSASSQDVQKAQEILQQTPAVRSERIQSLKEQIERGEYQVDARKIADKMLFSLLTDNIVSD